MPIDLGAHDLAHYKEQMNSPKSKCFLRTAFGTANRPPKYVIKRSFTVKRKMHGADYLLSITLPKGPNHLIICQYYPSFKHTEPIPLHNFLNILATNVGPVPETSVPIRFRVLQFEDLFDSGSYLTSRPRFRVGSGRVIGSSISI